MKDRIMVNSSLLIAAGFLLGVFTVGLGLNYVLSSATSQAATAQRSGLRTFELEFEKKGYKIDRQAMSDIYQGLDRAFTEMEKGFRLNQIICVSAGILGVLGLCLGLFRINKQADQMVSGRMNGTSSSSSP